MSSQKMTNSDAKGGSGRSRPTNNQLLYKAYLRWDHYSHKLHGNPQLPAETEACASVTSAFLQVMSILFEVESLRVENPRNILQMLSTNTRRTKVVELSSGTHRVPDELRRHSLSDGVGGQYSTNLDRNRYGADDQYLSTVIRYDLEFLRLCPCLVDVEIIDAKNGSGTILVSAGDDFCICAKDPARKGKEGEEGSQAKAQQSVSVVPWPAAEAARGQQGARGQAAAAAAAAVAAATAAAAGGARPMLGDPALAAAISAARADASAAAKSAGGSDLFDALLMAATGGGNKGQPQQAAAAAAAAATAAVEEGQVSSTPAVWPVPQPAVKRQRSRLYQSPNLNAPSIDQPTSPTSADASAQPKPLQSARKGSSNALNALSTTPDAAKPGPMALAKERSGENGLNSNNDMLVQSIMEGIDQGSLDAMDLGDLDGHDAEGIKASLRQANGGVLPANGAVNLAGMSRAFKDSELRRLEDEVKTLKEGRAEVEARLEEARVKEQAAAAAAAALRSDLGAAAPPPSAATQAEEKKVLGQQTWELAKERLAQRAQVSVPRMVSVLRLEVQRLNVARQQAETARQHAEERAAGSQAVAEALQRELAKVLAASDGPHAHQARAAVDADNARLRQQLEEARAALRRVEAERSALEECLAVTSVSSSAAPPAASMSLQPAPVTPQPHRNANPPSNMSDGDKQPEKAAVLLALTGREGSTTPPNSTTPDKTAPAAAVAPPSQAPPAAKQAAQPAKQSSPPSAQAMPSSTIVTPVGEESQKRKRPQEDDGTDPNPSSAAPAAVVGAMELPSDGLLPADAAAAFMATPPQSKEMADAQAAVAAIAASQPGATPAQIINAAIIVSQNMAAAAAAAAAATAAAPTSAALAAAAGFGGLAGAPIGSAVGEPGAMSFDAITAITAGVPDSFNKQAVVQGLADGAKVAAGAVQEGGAADASDAAAADFDVDQMLAPQAGMAPPVSGAAGAPLL